MKGRWFLLLVGALPGYVLLAAGPAVTAVDSSRKELAGRLVSKSARVREGESIQLAGCPADVDLLEDLAVAVRRLGGHPLITLSSDRLARQLFDAVPARFDSQPAAF